MEESMTMRENLDDEGSESVKEEQEDHHGATAVVEQQQQQQQASSTSIISRGALRRDEPFRGLDHRASVVGIIRNHRESMQNNNNGCVPLHPIITDVECEEVLHAFVKEDKEEDMTWTRRIVIKYLSKYKWYFPRRDDNDADSPSLHQAYAYYEHISLPRRLLEGSSSSSSSSSSSPPPSSASTLSEVNNGKQPQSKRSKKKKKNLSSRLALPGEMKKETRLYDPFCTPASALNDWGTGVSLYFHTLRLCAAVLFLFSLVYVPTFVWLATAKPDAENKGEITASRGDSASLRTSNVCLIKSWVVCLDCDSADYRGHEVSERRFGVTEDGTVLVMRNICEAVTLRSGLMNYFAMIFVAIIWLLVTAYWRARERKLNEERLTAKTYTLVVRNPPCQAYDPDEWRDFFNQFAEKQVTLVTVALNNGDLLRSLATRRTHLNNLRLLLPRDTNLDDRTELKAAIAQYRKREEAESHGITDALAKCCVKIMNLIGYYLEPEVLLKEIEEMESQIEEQSKQTFDVAEVFVTFETETGLQNAFNAINSSKKQSSLPPNSPDTSFRGVDLRIEQPSEPDDVKYENLGINPSRKWAVGAMLNCLSVALIIVSLVMVKAARDNYSPSAAGTVIAFLNAIVPSGLASLSDLFEKPRSQTDYEKALLTRITVYRWVTTVVIVKIITPFLATLGETDDSVLPTINAIMWTELFLTPAIRASDFLSNIGKHIIAPRTRTQDSMNFYFQGTFYYLGERYADMTKILFLVAVYVVLFPAVIFFGAVILLVQYMIDKFLLVRVWARAPHHGPELQRFTRHYFISGCILAHAVTSAYSWAQFPYDNVCDPVEKDGINRAGVYTNVDTLYADSKPVNITVSQPDAVVFCQQDWRGRRLFAFPPTSDIQPEGEKWMTPEQETLADLYGWTALAYFVAYFCLVFWSKIIKKFVLRCFGLFSHSQPPMSKSQMIDFSCVPQILGYVPHIKIHFTQFPLLACDIDMINQDLIGWFDPSNTFDFHNLTFDAPQRGLPRRVQRLTTHALDVYRVGDHPDLAETKGRFELGERGRDSDDENAKDWDTDGPSPIFSICKQYPTPWQQALIDEAAAKAKSTSTRSNDESGEGHDKNDGVLEEEEEEGESDKDFAITGYTSKGN